MRKGDGERERNKKRKERVKPFMERGRESYIPSLVPQPVGW